MIYITYILFAMLFIRFLVVTINFISRPYLKQVKEPAQTPMVSVLIPARNEEKNLPKLLTDLKKTDYPNIEIIVCNDQSTDGTVQVLNGFKEQMPNLQYFTNHELPQGWIGKNFACHKLSEAAKGEFMLFLDADVRLASDTINSAIAQMQRKKLSLLSVFPQQIMETKGEFLSVPIMNWILLTLLPLLAVKIPWYSSLSAANGQFMLFQGDDYRQNQWHLKVYNQNVDDILIARLIKKAKLKTDVKLGNKDVFCRMYENKTDAINGFARNIHQYFRGKRSWMLLFTFIIWSRLPFFAANGEWEILFLSIGIIIAMKTMTANLSRQNIIQNIGYHIHHLINMTRIVLKNMRIKRNQTIEWKGRIYKD
ncbi:glycosyltransferase [Alkalitalea saponilacus]|uniref:Glycosyl transferase family 2 n=1 Tax=Alkalitalea saponilacus TaxID=889453 RepID=A0A1T5HS75_9BACT|nr:glycosyltransferase family 2 protein [Alkalitalea saponilacus]ASB50016.1 hypothetical protein CDL62_13155 [Alkalitalea saponilacus]SKC23472.1 Glycosyl transferase family 2 [Alkalitalea saponilacus]